MNKTNIIILFLFLLSVSLVSGEFNAISPQRDIEICSCSTFSNPIVIENNGPVSAFFLTQSGKASEWSTLYPSDFPLAYGESQNVLNMIDAPCGKEGKYELITNIKSDLFEKELTQFLTLKQCNNIEVMQYNVSKSCPCEMASIAITIRNPLSFSETYSVQLEDGPINDYISVSESKFFIEGGKTKEILVYLTAPCDLYGNFPIDLVITAEKNDIRQTYPLEFEIEPCYDYQLTLGTLMHDVNQTPILQSQDEYGVCEGEYRAIPVNIKNEADFTNDFTFELKGYDWSYLMYESIQNLTSGSEFNNFIIVEPFGVYGNATLALSVSDKEGLTKKQYEASLNVKNCHSILFEFDRNSYRIQYGEDSIPFTVTNLGNDAEFSFDVVGSSWVSVIGNVSTTKFVDNVSSTEYGMQTVERVNLPSGIPHTFYLVTNPTEADASGKFDINITAKTDSQKNPYVHQVGVRLTSSSFAGFVYDYLIFLLLILILLLIFLFLVYKYRGKTAGEEKVKKEEKKIESPKEEKKEPKKELLDKEKTQKDKKHKAKVIENDSLVISQNVKKKKVRKKLKVGGGKPLKKVKQVNKEETIENKNPWWIFIIVFLALLIIGFFGWITTNGWLSSSNETTNESNGFVDVTSIDDVPLETSPEDITINQSADIELIENETFVQEENNESGELVYEDNDVESFDSNESLELDETPEDLDNQIYNESKKSGLSFFKKEEFDFENCTFTWTQGESLEYDLSSAFKDPDGDELFYSIISYPENLNVSLDDGKLTIYSPSFAGIDSIEVGADDGRGGIISSGSQKICVKPRNTFFDYLLIYKWYVLVGLILFGVLIALILQKNN